MYLFSSPAIFSLVGLSFVIGLIGFTFVIAVARMLGHEACSTRIGRCAIIFGGSHRTRTQISETRT